MSFSQNSHASQNYAPMYFLSALGAGGMSVTFFMFLLFWVPHSGQPVPVFEDISAFFSGASVAGKIMVAIAVLGIAGFTILHVTLMVWNFKKMSSFSKSDAFSAMHKTNAESQLMVVPLALAMSVNVGFIAGLVFVPGLWSVVEYLFPVAIVSFLAIGVFAFVRLGKFLGRILSEGGFNHDANNSFAQVLPGFAFAMIGVGLAAPAAMSGNASVVTISLIASTFFVSTAILWSIIAVVIAFRPMLINGVAPEAAPTLMILIPLVTVAAIAMMRMDHGLHVGFDVHAVAGETMVFLTRLIVFQVLIGMLGLMVLRRQNYAQKFLSNAGKRSPGSYALVCPGIALSILWQFWINKGLVATGVIGKFSVAYWLATAPAIILQVMMIMLVLRLHRLHFARGAVAPAAVPAE